MTVLPVERTDPATAPTVFAPDLFAGKVALVSGGSGDIGGATAWLLARLGAKVVLSGRNQERLDTTVATMSELGLAAEGHLVDIREGAAVTALFDDVFDRHGQLDLLVNSAGGQFASPAIDIEERGWNAVVDTNLSGTWRMCQTAARHWRDRGFAEGQTEAVILNIIIVTSHGLYGIAHSQAARAGVETFSKHLSVEWAQYGIRINCVAPGAIQNQGWRVYDEAARATYSRTNPQMRAGSSWDIAEACAYLASPAAGYITGENMIVDGGGQHWGEVWTSGKPDWFKAPD